MNPFGTSWRAGVGRQRAELAHATESRAEAASALEAARAAAELAKTSRDRVAKLFATGARRGCNVAWFQSFKTPLVIMSAIPFSLIGP